jgi:hypothetical protein
MQKKRSTRFKLIDAAVILFCFVGSIASGTAFWSEYTRTLTKLNEDPVAVIVFKKRTAQRKFIDRVVWDTLKQSSPVYNGDTIRTIEFSEAVVTFKDEVTNLTLNENTLIQIFYNDIDGARIDFSGGNLEVISGESGVVITSGSSAITVDGQANFNKNEKGFNISVLKGEAGFNGEIIESGNILAIDANGERDTSPAIAMTSFGLSARVLGAPGEIVPVVFSWNTYNFNPDTHVIVETALDRNFNRIVESRDVNASSVSIPLANGSYWWRAYPANGGSREPANSMYPSGTLEVIPVAAITALSPSQAERFTVSSETGVSLSWSAAEGAFAYLLEISANADMSGVVVSRRVEETGVTQTGLETGRWYWRVTPVFPNRVTGPIPVSAVNSFSLVQSGSAPVRQEPPSPPPPIAEPEPPPLPPPVVELVREEPVREQIVVPPEPPPPPPPVVEPVREEPVREQIVVQPEPLPPLPVEPEPQQPVIAQPQPEEVKEETRQEQDYSVSVTDTPKNEYLFSVGWFPMIPMFGFELNGYGAYDEWHPFLQSFNLKGIGFRYAYLPYRWNNNKLGIGFELSILDHINRNMVAEGFTTLDLISHMFLGIYYQRITSENWQTSAHMGIGFSNPYDYIHVFNGPSFAANAGVSAQYFFWKNAYVEAGMDLVFIWSDKTKSSLRPNLSVGWQFRRKNKTGARLP